MRTVNTYYEGYQSLEEFVAAHHDILFSTSNRAVLVQVFCGRRERDFIGMVVGQIRSLLPQAEIIGATSAGEIMNGQVSSRKTVLSFSVFQYTQVRVRLFDREETGGDALGREASRGFAGGRAKLLLLFSAGGTADAGQLLEGVFAERRDLPVAGGMAGNGVGKSLIFCKDKIADHGAVTAAFEGDALSVRQFRHLCWKSIGKEMTVTKADGSRVYTIDNLPAYTVYRKYLGVDCCISGNIKSIFPLIVNRRGAEIVCVPWTVYPDNSIGFSAEMQKGDKVHLSYGHVDMIVNTVGQLIQKIRKRPTESIFVYSCALRRAFLGDSAVIETRPLQQVAPTAGFYTKGEFYHTGQQDRLLSATMTTLALAEDGPLTEDPRGTADREDADEAPLGQNGESSGLIVLHALTNLVNAVTEELRERTVELEKMNEQNLYASLHDSLTGLYNRCLFEREMERLNRRRSPFGILICDVDGLKLLNDTLGHTFGDEILKAAAMILRSLYGEGHIVARIGGDEFAVLFQSSLSPELSRIYNEVGEYNQMNPSVPLSVSVGFAGSESAFESTAALFREADNNMYRVKLRNRKSVCEKLVKTMLRALEKRRIVTPEQSARMEKLFTAFALRAGVPQKDLPLLRLFARYYDIGKVGVPNAILFKRGSISQRERTEAERHSEIGSRIAHFSATLDPVADWILKHHEWWNGEGYPFGLKGEEIPIECRLMAIADAYNAMTDDRPYRRAMGREEALGELRRCAGIQFDPALVAIFAEMVQHADHPAK